MILSVSCVLFLNGNLIQAQDETHEPPAKFNVTINGQSSVVMEGEPTKVGGATIGISIDPYKTFSYAGMVFPYPSKFSFQADVEDAKNKSWTLSGTDLSVIVIDSPGLTLAKYEDELLKQYEGAKVNKKAVDYVMGGKNITGSYLAFTIGGTPNMIEIMPVGNGKFLVLHDALTNDGKHSEESQAYTQMLQKSFKLK
jgi:hypothetical protein